MAYLKKKHLQNEGCFLLLTPQSDSQKMKLLSFKEIWIVTFDTQKSLIVSMAGSLHHFDSSTLSTLIHYFLEGFYTFQVMHDFLTTKGRSSASQTTSSSTILCS